MNSTINVMIKKYRNFCERKELRWLKAESQGSKTTNTHLFVSCFGLKSIHWKNLNINLRYIIGRKNISKKWQIFLPLTNFFTKYFFYRGLICTNEYSYRQFFYKREHLVLSNLKILLVYLFGFKLDWNF